MAGAARRSSSQLRQLPLFAKGSVARVRLPQPVTARCAACRAHEARYGFRDEDNLDPPSTLCFECFRIELERRQPVAPRVVSDANPAPHRSSLDDTLARLDLRRRRAQIAARRALGI